MANFSRASRNICCAEVPFDGEILARRRCTSSELRSPAGGRTDYEVAMRAFGHRQDIDAGCGRRLRRSVGKSPFSDRCGVASGAIARSCNGLSERRLRGAPVMTDGAFGNLRPSTLAVNGGLETLDIDACCRRGRPAPPLTREDDGALQGRAFFDQVYHAERYAELLGRTVISPRCPEQNLLKGPSDLPMFCYGEEDGDDDDVNTSACEMQGHEPSPEVRQVLKALLPASGEIDVPMKMAARLETLAGIADRVKSGRQLREHLDNFYSSSPGLPEMKQQVHTEACLSEPPFPTLLRAASSGCGKPTAQSIDHAGKRGDKEPPERQVSESSIVSLASFHGSVKERLATQRRKAFNMVIQGGGRAGWKMIH